MKRAAEPLLASYLTLMQSLNPGCMGICILDGGLEECGSRGELDQRGFSSWLRNSNTPPIAANPALELARVSDAGTLQVALGLFDSTAKLIAVVGVALSESAATQLGAHPVRMLRQRLKPALDCLHRELASVARAKNKVATLSERTRDLEWLFQLAAELKSARSNREALASLLAGATRRMRSDYCALLVPAQQLLVEHSRTPSAPYESIRLQAQAQLLAWAQKHNRPLIMNRAGTPPSRLAPCKLLSVPLTTGKAHSIGVLVFINPPTRSDYVKRQAFLAADLAKHATQLLQSQYDLATGLLTRAALEETYHALSAEARGGTHSVLQIDIDRLHVINGVHGFATGDDIIIRLASLLAPPLLPRNALVARLAGDQFVVVLLHCGTQAAAALAAQLQQLIGQSPATSAAEGFQITLSCGITSLSDSALGLSAALTSASTACQAAKDHGRNRIEIFACDDLSIVQRHGDVHKMRSLEDALKNDAFELYAQPIVPLFNPELPGGYEVLLRLRKADSSIGTPLEFLSAAERYQMMPSIDRWVLDHALALAETHARVLVSRHISISLNVTAHSLADDEFVDYLLSRTGASRFPQRLLTIEITEQSAVRNLPRAIALMNRLRKAGCGVALDDFGTGTNSLAYLRDLPITRVKIDGSFVKNIANDRRGENTLKGIVELVRPFNVEIVAEYVEDAAIANKVRQMKIDYGQGYAFGKPEKLASLLETLQKEESREMHRLALEI